MVPMSGDEAQLTDAAPVDQQRVLELVAQWLGAIGYGTWSCPQGRELTTTVHHADDQTFCYDGQPGPAATGVDAAARGRGPLLNPAWDRPAGGPTPAVVMESDPVDWAVNCANWVQRHLTGENRPVHVEPYAGYALCIYPGGA
jgi:hypothetical protein